MIGILEWGWRLFVIAGYKFYRARTLLPATDYMLAFECLYVAVGRHRAYFEMAGNIADTRRIAVIQQIVLYEGTDPSLTIGQVLHFFVFSPSLLILACRLLGYIPSAWAVREILLLFSFNLRWIYSFSNLVRASTKEALE